MSPTEKNDAKRRPPNDFLRYSGMATKMGVVIGAAVFGGIKLDERTASDFPTWTLILSMLGVAAAIYFVIKDTQPRK